ncbi:topology modulation protein [Parvibaculum sp.]|uniref:topology modulation protein n=1 Tax=Parvibaculum sp. TaxID=2024848 RepID=UPI002C9BBAA6|nr:topology modulation protein [Parvibaculum sp.]HUD51995.1 topology modulation protein [Parvibaculum sp.]
MRRILVIGGSGGGKSTLARALGVKLDLPVIHLDQHWWKPGWVASDREDFRRRVAALVTGDRWIIDGNYSNTVDLRMPRADTIVWVDQPRRICLWRALRRAVTQWGKVRPDLVPGCPEKFDLEFARYIWNFKKKNNPVIHANIATHGAHARLARLRSDREIATFLAEAV